MATVSLFWDTNMAAMTSCENTQYGKSNAQISLLLHVLHDNKIRKIQQFVCTGATNFLIIFANNKW